jgi:hypothetical protein
MRATVTCTPIFAYCQDVEEHFAQRAIVNNEPAIRAEYDRAMDPVLAEERILQRRLDALNWRLAEVEAHRMDAEREGREVPEWFAGDKALIHAGRKQLLPLLRSLEELRQQAISRRNQLLRKARRVDYGRWSSNR